MVTHPLIKRSYRVPGCFLTSVWGTVVHSSVGQKVVLTGPCLKILSDFSKLCRNDISLLFRMPLRLGSS